jgi:hypothetical protein
VAINFAAEIARLRQAQLDTFGRGVQYQQMPAGAVALTVIPSRPQQLEDANPAYERVLLVAAEQTKLIRSAAAGDLATMDGVGYVVVKVSPAGGGDVYLNLNQTDRDPNA